MTKESPKIAQKEEAMALRRRGLSYSEIRAILPVPKSTLSLWLRDVEISERHVARLEQKRSRAARAAIEHRVSMRRAESLDLSHGAANDVRKISTRELWLMGIMLYWENSPKKKNYGYEKTVRFSTSNSALAKFFLRWLLDVGRIKKEDITFDIFLDESKRKSAQRVRAYWSTVTDFPQNIFTHIYYVNKKTKMNEVAEQTIQIEENKNYELRSALRTESFIENNAIKKFKKSGEKNFGLLRIRVRDSSLLQKQINGWVRGIARQFRLLDNSEDMF